ncbi:Hypothetical predicted protein, partial [Pelobates cultripes]
GEYRTQGEAGLPGFSPLEEESSLAQMRPTLAVSGADGRCPTIHRCSAKARPVGKCPPPLWTGGVIPVLTPARPDQPGRSSRAALLRQQDTAVKMAEAICDGAKTESTTGYSPKQATRLRSSPHCSPFKELAGRPNR